MGIAERIYETVRTMPEAQAAEVLDFAEYVKAKHPTPAKVLSAEEHRALCRELQTFVESQPMQAESASEFVRRMRDEAKY